MNPNNETSVSIPAAEVESKKLLNSILGKRKKLNEEGEYLQVKLKREDENKAPISSAKKATIEVGVGYNSAEDTGKKTIFASGNMSMSKK